MRKLERATKEFHVMLVEIISVHSFEVRIYSKFSFLCAKILNYCLMNCEVGYRTSCPEIVTGNRRDFDGWYKNGLLFPNALCLTTTKKLMIYAWCQQFTNAHTKNGLLLPVEKLLVFWKPHSEAYITFRNEGISHSQIMQSNGCHSAREWEWIKESLIWVRDATLRVSFDLNI